MTSRAMIFATVNDAGAVGRQVDINRRFLDGYDRTFDDVADRRRHDAFGDHPSHRRVLLGVGGCFDSFVRSFLFFLNLLFFCNHK